MKRMTFFQRLLIFFTLVSVIPILIIGFTAYNFFSKMQTEALIRQSGESVEKINQSMDSLIKKYESIMDALRQDTEVLNVLTEDRSEYKTNDILRKMYLLLSDKKNKIDIHIIGKHGNTAFSTSQIPNIYNYQVYKDWGIYRKIQETKNGVTIIAHKFSGISGDSVVLSAAAEIKDPGGKAIGFVIIDIYRNHIIEILSESNDLSMDLMMIAGDNTVILNSKSPNTEGMINSFGYIDRIIGGTEKITFTDIGSSKWLVAYGTSQQQKLTTVGLVPVDLIMENIEFVKNITILVSSLSLFVCIIVAFFISRNISKPVKALVNSMEKVEKGDLEVQVGYESWDEIAVLGKRFNMMVKKIKELLDKVVEGQERLRLAEIEALQAQINPHFLYNTLNAIKTLAKLKQNDQICTVITQLGKLLRNNIECSAEFGTVAENVQLIQSYIYIQNVRYNKFQVEISIDDQILDCRIPKLILQPIVENSIVHGLEGKDGPGKLMIRGWKEEPYLIFEIADNGIGVERGLVESINMEDAENSRNKRFGSIGISNVQMRIKLYYGEKCGLNMESEKTRAQK